jgi:CheY-like chemotaxis protein
LAFVSSKTVLVVDDSALIRQVVADAFKPEGYEVLVAGDGSEALRVLSGKLPGLIVCDILMPVMDGWRLCEELRKNPRTSEIPFIFLTTEKEVQKRVHAFRLGADDYLTKPFSQEELVARADRLLERSERLKSLGKAAEGLAGHTRHLPVADLLQILSLNSKSGALKLTNSGGSTGTIFFREGKIIQAEIGIVQGEKALFRIMMWHDSKFVFEDLPDNIGAVIEGSTPTVLMEGFTHFDELRDLTQNKAPLKARYKIPPQVESFIDQLDLTEVQKDLINGLRKTPAVHELLDQLPHRDLEIHRALIDLVEKGFAEGQDGADTQPVPKIAGTF